MSILNAAGQRIISPTIEPQQPNSQYNTILEPFRFKPGPGTQMGNFCNVPFDQMPKEDLIAVITLREVHWNIEMKKVQAQHMIELARARNGR